MASHPELRAQAMGCLGCPPCLRTRVAKRARSCPSVGMWSSQQPLAKAPRQWGQGPAPAPTPLLHPLQQASSPGGPQPSWGAEGPSPGHLVPCGSGKCQGYSQREKAPRLPWGTWVESGGPRPPPALGIQQRGAWWGRRAGRHPAVPHPCSGAGGAGQCPVGGSPLWLEGTRGTVTLSGCGQTWRHPGPSG